MSCFDVKILDPDINTITIESCIGDQPSSIDIVTYDNTNILEISHCLSIADIKVKDILAGSGINIVTSSGIYTVSLSDTYLTSSDIADFLESVQDIIGQSGLSAGDYVNLSYNDSTGLTTISVTGLQPSGNYSVVGHTHVSSNITDFASSVSGLLPSVTGIGQASSTFVNNVYTISVSGLQPSGNYSLVGHTHTSSNITDFDSSVSGLLPVKNITAGSGIGISSVSGDFTVSVTGTFGLTSEEVDDRVSNLLVAGNYVNLNYNDNSNSLTISVTGLQPSGNYSLVGHTHLSSDITNFDIAVSGLIPPSNFTSLSGVSGITVSNSGTNYIVSLTDPTIQLADITDLSSNGRTFLLTPSSSNLATLITDETGSGFLVFNNSPALSGTPTVPTAPSGTNNAQIANTAFVRTEITNLVNSAPSTLDTLNELASALGNDPNFATTITNSLASKAALNGAIFTGSVTIPSGTGNFNSLTVNGTGVSLSGHTHISSNITDFSTSVSGLLPVKNIVGGSGIGVSSLSGIYTISTTGNFGLTSEEVDDRVSNLLVAGSYTNINYNDNANTLTISVTGLQPSGNYANAVHSHTSSDITNFDISVSGLIGIQNLVGVSGIQIASSGTTRQISTNLLSGNGVAFTYNNDNSLTINTISNNGRILISDNITTNLTIPSGYVPGSLSIYQNGVKLLDSIDYTATNGSGIVFTNSPTSGTYIEYSTPTIGNNIHKLVQSNITGITGSSVINNIVQISQSNYDALITKDPNTVYFIV